VAFVQRGVAKRAHTLILLQSATNKLFAGITHIDFIILLFGIERKK